MIDVSATIERIGRLAPDASEHEHRDAAIRLILAYDGHAASISRVLSILERVSYMGAIKKGGADGDKV